MRQIEVSRTLVFDDPRRVRTVFEELLAGNMNLGRPGHAGVIFATKVTRRTPGTSDEAGRRVPAMRFADPRVQALAGCLTVWDHAVHGITNKSLRAWMTGLRGTPYSMNQASYDLARLRRNRLIERIARTNTYRLTADGLTFALVYSRVHDQVLYPLTAHDQPIAAPADIRAAWRAIIRHIDSTIADAHLGRAA